MTDPDESRRLAARVTWKVIQNAHGIALHVTCPLCGHNLISTHNDHLLVVDNSDSYLMWIGQEIEYCLRRHLGRDEDYPDGRGKRTCTAEILYADELKLRFVIRAHDLTYWREAYRFNGRYDEYDWALEPVTADWLQRQVQEQKEIAATAQTKLETLDTILARLQTQV